MNDDWYTRCTLHNHPICDFYIRFDRLLEDIRVVFDKLSITDLVINIDINKNTKKECDDYHSMYTDYTKDIVTKQCKEEIEYFNWIF